MDPQVQTIIFYLLFIPHMLFALSAHEASHAGSAYLLGDDTAAHLGRLTLNPLRHLDPLGVLAFFLVHFGWAKPVPINPLRLKNPKVDTLFIGLAGPMSNLFLGVCLLAALRLFWSLFSPFSAEEKMFLAFLFVGAQLNIGLCFFNLIPVPPLDGSHILFGLLPDSVAERADSMFRQSWFGPIVLIIIVFWFGRTIIQVPMHFIVRGFLGPETWSGVIRLLMEYNFF